MPRFSVIVPVYKVQAYLHECLRSVLEQSFTDLEVIAVDDCSPDACGEIIDEFAARDARVRAVHLSENVGLGRARNAGLEHATGDYVLFLDSDDTFTPGALQAIADRIKETGSPDVLHFDYARTFWDGREVRNQLAHLLTQEGPAVFRLSDRPGLLRLLMVVWSKAFNRDFIEREGFAFPPGYYEDTPWTYPVLMAAESIATLDRVCVHYRQRRQGNILGTTSRKHFDIFDQYERVFEFLDQHPDLDAQWRAVIFRRMVDHLSTLFTKRGRLPRRSRAEFLRKSRAYYARYRTPGARVPGRTRLRHALVRLGTHRTYRALWTALAVRRRLSRTVTKARRAARATALQLHYRIQLRLPVREKEAVFSSYWGRGHGCNPGALEEAFRTHAPHIRTSWIAAPEHQHTVPPGTRRLTPGTAAYWTALARSKYLVNNVNFDRRLVKRPGQVFVQTQHGTPLKRMGLDLQDRPAASRGTDFGQLLRSADKWDYVLSANRHSTLVWERVFPASYTTLEYGYPRNDLFRRASSQDRARLRDTLGIPRDSIAVLYAPTHRDYRITQRLPLDLERMLRTLGPRFTILTRAHHAYEAPLSEVEAARLVDVSGHPSVEALCIASDALVTDYSSLMFDYAALDRPIVIHADDWEAYEAARGTYFDLRAFPPGAVARSEDELIDIFATGHWRGSRSAQLRTAFRERFCPYEDGRAGERVVRRVVFGEEPTGASPAVPHQVEGAGVSAPLR
ncbi:bifunctional glycosyltransferase family 2 protein/CDP-glycerol:glycerophosphate glycerophosphotransferase [Streptomyces sp. VRA16 Mangrove soil]|uniref:bifunctional glycosyltransferase/CDP-glycerol:glycerophosphate glycerophosphotransferase n=1 Tax=Streptomyces sp. VRA16 Mangrove soil TaxID=2817434 RepID=UPI001A9DB817|nr:bifunctional glycosyltransferase family 2 protein/CDP-glycerol:glycerophosphate glycerophosphotransferase [Streptomyces sp. VRA16 Mangrove soil]MBO1337568.1 bifunctional glycosyltransferase family 2 protein/CDP-glycerol:glycerophosphate glycerophosphotransferase [Streptomyces sp. VRA16 Mangrove soil]